MKQFVGQGTSSSSLRGPTVQPFRSVADPGDDPAGDPAPGVARLEAALVAALPEVVRPGVDDDGPTCDRENVITLQLFRSFGWVIFVL